MGVCEVRLEVRMFKGWELGVVEGLMIWFLDIVLYVYSKVNWGKKRSCSIIDGESGFLLVVNIVFKIF